MTERKQFHMALFSIPVYAAVFALAAVLKRSGTEYLSGILLGALAIGMYFFFYLVKGKKLLQMEGVLALFWTGGVGLAAFQLSHLATEWTSVTWLCFGSLVPMMILGYEVIGAVPEKHTEKTLPGFQKAGREEQAERLMKAIYAILLVSAICFAVEACFCEIPLFSDKPHAYSYFHITGVHYFTVTGIFGLPLAVIYANLKGTLTRKEKGKLLLIVVVSLAIPILCVSRFQLMLAVFLAICVELCMKPSVKLRYLIPVLLFLGLAYVLLTVARNHDVAYLNGIFEMKNPATPIFITQPYMYVANNYDNFNCLVEGLEKYTLGLRQLFPVFALTGLKFVFPQLVSFPLYITKTELTTVTLIYDAYYDFGVIGVMLFGLLLGVFCAVVSKKAEEGGNPVAFLFYGQIVMYLVFSFFTTWYSNPTTWFWLVITAMLYFYTGLRRVKKNDLGKEKTKELRKK